MHPMYLHNRSRISLAKQMEAFILRKTVGGGEQDEEKLKAKLILLHQQGKELL